MCSLLDDYFARDLMGDDRAGFVAHLQSCAECRRNIQEQERLNVMLTEATVRLDRVPTGLLDQVDRRVCITRRRRTMATALAVAATIAGIWLVSHRGEPDVARKVNVPLAGTSGSGEFRPAHVRIAFPRERNLFAVPVESESPNVTVFWVFPAPERSER
jgi:hypothetical protein